MWRLLLLALVARADDAVDKDGESSRKILGSSVVTSVSVIMDAGNGSKIYADAVGRPVSKPQMAGDVASPIDLLSPDRYEFYTFDDTGDLVKRLMTLEEIHDIIATGDDEGLTLDGLTSNGFLPEKRVNDVVNNVQNVLKEEIKMHKNPEKNHFDTPDVSDSWSMILPAVFGNSGEDIKPEGPVVHVTPDTIMIEPEINVMATTEQISTTEKVMTLQTKKTTPRSTTTTTARTPMINVEIITNSNSTTEKTINVGAEGEQVVEIKPHNDLEMTKQSIAPVYQLNKSTKRPYPVKVTTFRPTKKPVVVSSTTKRSISTTSRGSSISTTSRSVSTTSTTPRTESKTTSEVTSSSTTTKTVATTTPQPSTQTTTTSSTTTQANQPMEDALAQSSTVIFEKVAPPQTTTTTEQTTSQTISPSENLTSTPTPTPTSTEVPEILTTTTEIPTSSTLLESTTTEFSTTPDLRPTFIPMEKLVPETTETPTTSTFAPLSTFFIVSDNKISPESLKTTNEDLNTLSTEYVTSSKLPANFSTTTESQSTDRTSTALEQLLLTSTNIYEINSELSEVRGTTENLDDSSTTHAESTEKFLIRLTNPTEAPTTTTTDRAFIETIEQLISQAVGTPAPPVESEKEAMIVEQMIMNSSNKTMPEVMSETATLASKLVGVGEESTTVPPTTLDDMSLLSDSVGSLLSQVYGQGLTTVENDISTTTESSTEAPTTTISSTAVPTTTTTTTTTEFVPHIINITIIRNDNRTQSKPAKADLSLEKQYEDLFNEMQKNSSLEALAQNDEVLKTEATAFVDEEEVTDEPVETTTEDLTTTDAPTTTSTTTTSTTTTTTTVDPKPSIVITIHENKTTPDDTKWMLVSTVKPHMDLQHDTPTDEAPSHQISTIVDPPPPVDLVPKPLQGFGLEDSTAKLDTDIYQFVQLCNELAFGFWKSVTTGISTARSVIVSPFAATSLLAMVFLGARGATSGEMNEILKLDDMVTFNPHLIFKNVSESIEANSDSGVAISAIVRELFSDRSKGKLLGFYKERVRQFYDGHVEEASFREIGDIIRRRTNLLVKKNTDGKIMEFLKEGNIVPKPPLAGISVSIFQTDCSQASTEGRDGELHFVVLPSLRQRRLIPIPSIVYRSGFLAGYEPSLDATAAALGTKEQTISTIFIIPGQQGLAAPGDGLARLEKRLVESSFKKGAWSRLLRALIPRPGLELQIPRFQHRSLVNATQSLKRMGLHELFDARKADLKGLNGAAHDLHLSEVIQVNEFATCGERRIGEAHHREVYPATLERKSRLLLEEWEEPRDYQRAFHDPLHDPSLLDLPLALRPRQARLPEAPRLRFDRPFLYFVRHNPSGLILHMGRFHPRLLP